jgi:hypothetical protein
MSDDVKKRAALLKSLAKVAVPQDGYSSEETGFVAPLQRAADDVAPGLNVRVLWDAFGESGYGGDSEVVAVHRVFNTVYVYDLPVAFDDDDHLDQPYANLLLIALGCIADGSCEPLLTVPTTDLRRWHEDDFNLYFERKPNDV